MSWDDDRARRVFSGRSVWIVGEFETWTASQLRQRVVAAGARRAVVTRDTSVEPGGLRLPDLLVSGVDWGKGVNGFSGNKPFRRAIGQGATVWTEGELLLEMEGRDDFPQAADIPSADRLSVLDVLEEGALDLPPPGNHTGTLTLRWKKVAASPHRRFLEMFGFPFRGPHQYIGRLYYNGTRLQPTTGSPHSFCAVRFTRGLFWENGAELNEGWKKFSYDGSSGFNCTPLVADKGATLKWSAAWPSGWEGKFNRDVCVFGDISQFDFLDSYWVNLDEGLWKVDFFGAENIIDPGNPYGR